MPIGKTFGTIANAVARAAGKPLTFAVAVLSIVVWLASGPVFHYSDTWQLIINTSTTIITFLMVFLIQNSQNRDNAAIQVKLDELIRVSRVRNMFVGIENLSDEELDQIRKMCESRAEQEDTGDDDRHSDDDSADGDDAKKAADKRGDAAVEAIAGKAREAANRA